MLTPILMTSLFELLNQLARHRVRVYLAGDRLRIRTPWPLAEAPEEVRPLLRELKHRQDEVAAYLRGKVFPYPLPGTLGLGGVDPLDVRWINGKPVLDPGWWRELRRDERPKWPVH